jgi:hypothetical protein
MTLTSNHFRDDRRLQACLINDQSHVKKGDIGPFVRLLQDAVYRIDGLQVSSAEFDQMRYGDTTAAAVLAYKRKRHIINRSYQTTEDDIVGKMTIASLDGEMNKLEAPPAPSKNSARRTCNQAGPPANRTSELAPELPSDVRLKIAAEAFSNPGGVTG